MINWFALGAAALYVGAGVLSAARGNVPLAGMWLGYAVANCFLVWAEARGNQ